MNEEQLRQIEEWNFLPDTFRSWIRRAKEPTVEGHIWNQYMDLMFAMTCAFSRAPLTEEECAETNIDNLFKAEIESLTLAVKRLLQQEGEGDVETLP